MNRNDVQNLKERLNFSLRHSVPQILQTESAECGLACLVMICRYYHKDIDLFSLRHQFGISSHGATLALIIDIANKLGFGTRPLSLDLEEINQLKLPCVIHWDLNHFVVLVAIKANKIIIHDPAFGRRLLSKSEFSLHFTGIALELWPEKGFVKDIQRQDVKSLGLLKNINGLNGFLIKIFALSLIVESINLLLPVGTQLVMDHVILAEDHDLLTLICLGLFFFIVFKTVIGIFRSWITLRTDSLIDIQWKNSFFNHLLKLPLNYFEKRSPGDIQSRFNSLDAIRKTFTTGLVGGLIDTIISIGLIIMMFLYGGWLIWVVLVFTLIYILMRLFTFYQYRQASEEQIVKGARANSHFMESLYGISTLKVLGLDKIRSQHWMNLNVETTNANIRVTRLDLFYGGVNTFISTFDQIIILWLGASMVIDHQMTLGMFVAFNAYRGQFSDRAANLISLILQLRMMSLHNERLSDIAMTESEPQSDILIKSHESTAARFEVKDLSYTYDAFSAPIIKNLSLNIQAGESVGIIGPSGSGKSTLMKLMAGLLLPQHGSLRINDLDIYQIGLNNYRQYISCVLQDDKLFAGSIADNIASFDQNKNIDRIIEVAQQCNILNEIRNMPMGFETLVSDLGSSLSGGQVQRILIARALYRQPSILFMDEATSHLDIENEAIVNQSIKNLMITRVFIAHRKSTIDTADRIIEIEKI